MKTPTGIHHLTAIASDPQANVDFYAGLLGLRLVKKTVNFDDPSAYHLYYGDESGTPGSIVTFFYWPRGLGTQGRVGSGQTTRLSFSAAHESLPFWQDRLSRQGVAASRDLRFDEDVLRFTDPDGIPVEIVAVANDARTGWVSEGISRDFSLRGMHTAELTVATAGSTEKLIAHEMGYRVVRQLGNRTRFEAGRGGSGTYIDLIVDPDAPRGLGGVGTIHHIAWRIDDDASQVEIQAHLHDAGYLVSGVRDRSYFHSIYYREPNGILFEIATDSPGFATDESVDTLGTSLRLPAQFERARGKIELLLPPLQPAHVYARSNPIPTRL